MNVKKMWWVLVVVLISTGIALGADQTPLLLQTPTLSKTQIAFAYGGDIWIVDRKGGEARRLVTGIGHESSPIFSPDGQWVAFTGDYDGNTDVYVVPAEGGQPRRLTYHPDPDVAVAWTPDGKSVLFRSHRASYSDPNQFFTVPLTGGLPAEIPLPMAEEGTFSPDGTKLAYVPNFQWEPFWQNYRGGQTTPIWIVNVSDSSVVAKVPRENSNDRDPMWVGDTIYFISDRNGALTLFAYDTRSNKVTQVVDNKGRWDILSASAGPGAIVYEQFGSIHLYDLKSHREQEVPITVAGDMPQLRPHFVDVSKKVANAQISPTGQRAVFEAHGEILTVPAEKGSIRDITNSPTVEDRDPAWSPDGKSIAYFSDESGEYALHIRSQDGLGEVKKIDLGQPPSFFYTPTWSPDNKKIAYSDKRLNLWYVDLDHPTPVKVDTDLFDSPLHQFDVVWSPDNKWLAYTKQLENHLRAVFVYSLDTKKATQITDGMSDCLYPNWDANGKYLYFTASTDMGLTAGWLDMTNEAHPVTRSVYVAVLAKDLPSPLAPESDDEKAEEKKDGKDGGTAQAEETGKKGKEKGEEKAGEKGEKAEEKKPVKVTIDFEGINQRILAMPIPAENYIGISAGKTGELFLAELPPVPPATIGDGPEGPKAKVSKFELKTRKVTPFLPAADAFVLSFNGEKALYKLQDKWFIVPTDKEPKPTDGALKMDNMEVYEEPHAMWSQMYNEVWRIERDFFYDPHYHGLNLEQAKKTFAPFLPGIASRNDLSYLFREMLSYMEVGHMFVGGGEQPEQKKVTVGLLGADYKVENGRYRITKVYSGENWNPKLHAPLTQPGVNVKAAEYLLAVNGRNLPGTDNIYSFFLETAGKQTVIKVGPNPDGEDSRDVTVEPIPSETALRNLDWIEGNRRQVDKLSDGKLAYVYLPNTAGGGFTNFNRYYFSQIEKEGAVIDERFNHGGQLADYIIDHLRRPVLSIVMSREGQEYKEPVESIYGPKVMIINQFAGSGGDALPWYFRGTGIGPLVGVKTWGGLVGIGGYPPLMDGGMVMAPRWAIYGLHGEWEVEGHGIPPDYEVEMDPKLWREGHDPQLEKAVSVALQLLKEHPLPKYPRAPYPDHHQQLPTTPPGE
ncbi:MAG TPA: PDZ domain-containing protein [Terriglobia bacterium]|nr:PDZ domain-containing protein [Terriglobia bacterium]